MEPWTNVGAIETPPLNELPHIEVQSPPKLPQPPRASPCRVPSSIVHKYQYQRWRSREVSAQPAAICALVSARARHSRRQLLANAAIASCDAVRVAVYPFSGPSSASCNSASRTCQLTTATSACSRISVRTFCQWLRFSRSLPMTAV
jgi:hypothetical protein